MINFKEVVISDKEWMKPLIAAGNHSGCHQNFTNIFAWAKAYDTRVAKVNDYLVVKGGESSSEQTYFYPAGKGDIQHVIEEMKEDAKYCGHPFVLTGISPENIEVLNELFPNQFEYKEMRDAFDYVYLLDRLVSLSGKKLHGKRNHINNFLKNDNWSFENITTENLAECWAMNKQWCVINDCHSDDDLHQEACAVRKCFENFTELELEGGLLRLDGKIIAYTMGEKLNADTYVVHIEKAFGDIQGAYPMINRQFASYIQQEHSQMLYVNREEDMGNEGLRRAKRSYDPYKMEEKYMAYWIEK